jgi:ABC-type sugar transport system ATPase subunit
LLSGGTQQKVLFGRLTLKPPRVLVLDEPTRGVDVGARAEIYGLINTLAAQGVAIAMISSDLPELLGMSDRILVMRDGRMGGELARADASAERIMSMATHA